MTGLLEKALRRIEALSLEEQDAVASWSLWMTKRRGLVAFAKIPKNCGR